MTEAATQADPSAVAVTPFWQRMPRLFLFPLQRAPLLRNALSTLFFCVVALLTYPNLGTAPLRAGLLMLFAWCAASLYMARFAFLVIERSAYGYLDSRTYPRQEQAGDWRRPVKMFLVMVVVPVLIIVVGHLLLPGVLVLLALLAFALLLPASVMVMTLTDSFADAVSPTRCARMAWSIGPPYLLLCLFLLMLLIGSQQALHVLLPGPSHAAATAADATQASSAATLAAPLSIVSLGLTWLIVSLVGNYFLVLTCALIGYTMYQYSAVLGIAVVGPGDAPVRGPISSSAHARRVREALIGKLVAAGEFREAIELLSDELRTRPTDLSLHARLHTLLLHEGSTPRIEDHAERYLELLLAASNLKEALALFEQTRKLAPAFTPRDPARLPQLANAAIEAVRPELAAELIRGFDRKYPGHPNVPEVYVVAGRLLLQADRASEAQGLLQHVTKSYPDSRAAAEAKRYLARFEPVTGAVSAAAPAVAASAPPPGGPIAS